MFIEKDVIAIKVTTGEEILARFIRQELHELVVEHPAILVPSKTGQLNLVAAMFTGDLSKEIKINLATVVMLAPAKEDLATMYVEAISGIALPKPKIILG